MNAQESKQEALKTIASILIRCEKIQPKFKENTSQYTLLKNRIKAIRIAQSLLEERDVAWTMDELQLALPPVTSIIHKCEKARMKYERNTKQYLRYEPTIRAMHIAKDYIEAEICKIG